MPMLLLRLAVLPLRAAVAATAEDMADRCKLFSDQVVAQLASADASKAVGICEASGDVMNLVVTFFVEDDTAATTLTAEIAAVDKVELVAAIREEAARLRDEADGDEGSWLGEMEADDVAAEVEAVADVSATLAGIVEEAGSVVDEATAEKDDAVEAEEDAVSDVEGVADLVEVKEALAEVRRPREYLSLESPWSTQFLRLEAELRMCCVGASPSCRIERRAPNSWQLVLTAHFG